jgi:hypothetical protein
MRRSRTIPALILPILIAACSNSAAPDATAQGERLRPGAAALDGAPTPVDSTAAACGGNLMGGN